jgi:hypothetical protein
VEHTRALIAACVALVSLGAGCGSADRERAATEVTQRFHAALLDGDGARACKELTQATVSSLERSSERPCAEAILLLALPPGGQVASARVFVTSAVTRLAEGATTFLEKSSHGWQISAAGCEPTLPDQPYECELEG